MPDMKAKTTQNMTLSAVITRADGTVEDLGIIAEGYRCMKCGGQYPSSARLTRHLCWVRRLFGKES